MQTKPKLSDEAREYFRQAGAAGGKIGGPARWKGTTAKQRSAAMKRVAAARSAYLAAAKKRAPAKRKGA